MTGDIKTLEVEVKNQFYDVVVEQLEKLPIVSYREVTE